MVIVHKILKVKLLYMEAMKARELTKRDNKLQGLKGDATAGKKIISGDI